MPFTLAHSAAVLPFLKKRYFSATGLIAGSMSPDFEYFLRMDTKTLYSHSLGGLFYFNIPVGLAISFIFHMIVKRNLIQAMPASISSRFQDTLQVDLLSQKTFTLIISILVGAFTHIFWDNFTHNGTYATTHLTFYKHTFVPFQGVRYPLFYALQYISTFVGLAILAIYTLKKKPGVVTPFEINYLKYWSVVFTISATIVLMKFYTQQVNFNLPIFVVSCISGLCAATIITGLLPFKKRTKIQ